MNSLYAYPRERMLGAFNWTGLDIMLIAWSGTYAFNEGHVLTAAVLASGAVAQSSSLPATGIMVRPGGYARTNPIVLPNVPVVQISFLTLCERGLSPDQHQLICFLDEGVGLPFMGTGLDQPVQPDWLNARGWFRP